MLTIYRQSKQLIKKTTFQPFSLHNLKKCFSSRAEDNLEINTNEIDSETLDVTIPKELQAFYSFGPWKALNLYENPGILGKFTTFIPLPKLTILCFSAYTYMSYGSALFQPSLLLTLYLINKHYLCNFSKYTQIILLSIEENCEKLYIRTLYGEYRFELSDIEISNTPIKVGNTMFYEVKSKSKKMILYMSMEGNILNFNLLKSILSGKFSKVNFIV